MNLDQVISEVKYRTARSGGKGGQHVNKVETKVEAIWHVENSLALSDAEMRLIFEKLEGQISAEGLLSAVDQSSRSQLKNKELATNKLIKIIKNALVIVKKRRIKAIKANPLKRLDLKRRRSETKANRQNPLKQL